MSVEVKKGSTDVTLYFKLVDDTTGSAKAGLVVSAVDATYIRTRRLAVKGDVSAVAASADSAHVDNQGFEVDATNAPGLYRIDFVDAAFANSSDVPQVVCVINHVSCDPAMQLVSLVANVGGELASGAITSATFAVGAIDASAIASDAIDASAIAANAITAAKFAVNAINASAIAADAIDASAIAAGAITAAKFASDAITSSVVAAGAITAAKFAAGAIDAAAIASDAIDASAIAAGAITAAKFASDAITASVIAADAITAPKFAGGAINASAIAADAITAAKIADGAIDAATFAANAVNASAVATDAVTEITAAVWAVASRTITGLTQAALTDFFDTDSGVTYASAVAGSVVKEIADNAGGSALTEAGIAAAVWDATSTGHVSAGKAGAQLWTNIDAILADTGTDGVVLGTNSVNASAVAADAIDSSAIAAGAITAAKFASGAITATVVADGAIDAATFAANAINASALAADAVSEIWTTGLTEAYAADGAAFTGAQALFMIWAFLAEKAVTTTTLTANQLDGATPAMTFSLDSATAPTTITRAS